MTRFLFRALCASVVSLTAVAPSAHAQQQAGYTPEASPYREVPPSQSISLFTGYFSAGKDPIRAHPGSAPLLGLRYEITVGGPAQFFVRGARISSKRNSYDPSLAAAARPQGEVSVPMYLADVGFNFNITGRKSWHSIVPTAGFALGVASSTTKAANDPYSFGTQFAFSTEFGIRHVSRGPFEWRVTAGNTLYQTKYPNAYFTNGSDGTPLLGAGTSKTSYRNNWVLTAGLSYAWFR